MNEPLPECRPVLTVGSTETRSRDVSSIPPALAAALVCAELGITSLPQRALARRGPLASEARYPPIPRETSRWPPLRRT